MSRPLLLGLGLLILATLTFVCLRLNGPGIEHDIQSRAQQLAIHSGLPNISTSVSGRDVTLSGNVSLDADRQMLENRIADVDGVRKVINLIKVAPSAGLANDQNGRFQVDYDGQYMALTGAVTDEKTKQTFLDKAAKVVGTSKVAEALELSATGLEATKSLANALPELAALEFAQLVVEGKSLIVQGYTSNPDTRTSIEKRINEILGDQYDITYMIEAPEITDAPAATEPAPGLASDCQQQFNALLSTENIVFESASADISAKSNALLKRLADVINNCPAIDIEIGGHTDTRGDAEMNLDLSQRRASAVKSALVKLGINKSRLLAVGYGETRPIANETTPSGLQKNRRIEFVIKE